MKKSTLTIFFSFAFLFIAHAQLKQIAAGPGFEEPEEGFAKIIQMKNGNTVFIHISSEKGINAQVYDAKHAKIAWTNSMPSYGTLKWKGFAYRSIRTEEVFGIFEINNDVLIFLGTDLAYDKSTVRKLIIDGTTGKLKTDQIYAELKYERFIVVKDQLNEHYATFISGRNDKEIMTQSKIVLYNSDHKEIRSIKYDVEQLFGKEYDGAGLRDLLMINDKIYAFFFAYLDKKTKGNAPPPGNSFIAISENGSTFSKDLIQLKLPAEMPVWGSYGLRYNPVVKRIYVFVMENNYYENYKRSYHYNMFVNVFDPETKNIQGFEGMGINDQVNEAYKKRFSKKDDYLGMAQNLYVNDDGSFSLICEEHMMGGVDADNTWIGKVLQANYDKDGKLKSAYILPKFHKLFAVQQFPFSRAEWENTAQTLYYGSQYKFFLYLDGAENKYLLYNDLERNNDVKGDRYTAVPAVKDCDTYIYKLTGTELVPEKIYAFGDQGKDHKAAMLSVADYNKKTNTLVTLVLSEGKMLNVVWLQPQ